MNDSPNTNPIRFTIGVYNQEPITYKHPYTLFVPLITPQDISSRYANKKYCLFFVNLTFYLMIMLGMVMNYITCLSIKYLNKWLIHQMNKEHLYYNLTHYQLLKQIIKQY